MTNGTREPAIRVKDLDAGYRGHIVLHDLTVQIDQAQCVALTGNNGSGKSTLLKALIGTLPIMHGSVELLGYTRNASGQSSGTPPWYQLGYVPQRLASAGGIESTVQEVVQSGLLGAHHLRLPRDWRKKVTSALDEVGMTHALKSSFHDLSGGQQQRVLIARAIVREPSLLLLDEPLTGLDEHNRVRLREILQTRLNRGATMVVVLHELGELRPLIEREVRISAGHIVFDGPCTHETHPDKGSWWEHGYNQDGESNA